MHCAHGILPVPAQATAYLMKEIPMYAGDLEGEFCTPTGAALLKHFVKKYEQMPVLQMEEIGYGFGKREYERLNCVRAILGETQHKVEEEIKELVERSNALEAYQSAPDAVEDLEKIPVLSREAISKEIEPIINEE